MTNATCPTPTQLFEALSGALDHPLREHLAGCASCQALVQARDAFVGDDLADRFPSPDEAAAAARLSGEITSFQSRKSRRVAPNSWLAMAAVLVVGIGLWTFSPQLSHLTTTTDDAGGEAHLRGAAEELSAWRAPQIKTADRELAITWTAITGADNYQVVLLTADLLPVANYPIGPGTTLSIPRGSSAVAQAGTGFVVVIARHGDQELDRTPPAVLP